MIISQLISKEKFVTGVTNTLSCNTLVFALKFMEEGTIHRKCILTRCKAPKAWILKTVVSVL